MLGALTCCTELNRSNQIGKSLWFSLPLLESIFLYVIVKIVKFSLHEAFVVLLLYYLTFFHNFLST